MDECEVEMYFHNQVRRIHEDPRVTKPYTDEQWAAIEALGHQVDAELKANDVRLTMGGEPTFVSIDDMEGAEWNTAALGPDQEAPGRGPDAPPQGPLRPRRAAAHRSGQVVPRRATAALGALLLLAQGRRAGVARPALFGLETQDYGHGPEQAATFIRTLAKHLGVDPAHAEPAYEDVWYYLWKEQRLPANVDPLDNKLKDPNERKRIARLFDQGLNRTAGYCLPLRWWGFGDQGGWKSGKWTFRDGRLFLIPGDSSMGFRLPLDSLPYLPEAELDKVPERNPFEPVSPLRSPTDQIGRRYSQLIKPAQAPQTLREQGGDPRAIAARYGRLTPADDSHQGINPQIALPDDLHPDLVRTALCIEPREGRLYCFLPPLTHLEHWLDLALCLEDTAAELKMPIIIEGYEPPRDHRLQKLAVTPDPGVIEVNIHPSDSWDDMVRDTQILYEEARLARLGTEKFMLDGRHTGTGGGNHVTLGGPTPADSPLLRKPDLVQSLITYWQHHPSLSYLFSGMFIGPTSQAPRVDEARDDRLYELAIAFQQMPQGQVPQPWIVDRVLRNLLTDVTGNTHRTEFCIDKLYSPDSASGRQGLVEFRGFEMPPHARMSLAQMSLMRALVARFWKEPYTPQAGALGHRVA